MHLYSRRRVGIYLFIRTARFVADAITNLYSASVCSWAVWCDRSNVQRHMPLSAPIQFQAKTVDATYNFHHDL